jgi:hypothetical protein
VSAHQDGCREIVVLRETLLADGRRDEPLVAVETARPVRHRGGPGHAARGLRPLKNRLRGSARRHGAQRVRGRAVVVPHARPRDRVGRLLLVLRRPRVGHGVLRTSHQVGKRVGTRCGAAAPEGWRDRGAHSRRGAATSPFCVGSWCGAGSSTRSARRAGSACCSLLGWQKASLLAVVLRGPMETRLRGTEPSVRPQLEFLLHGFAQPGSDLHIALPLPPPFYHCLISFS